MQAADDALIGAWPTPQPDAVPIQRDIGIARIAALRLIDEAPQFS